MSVLVIDVGTTGLRAAVVRNDGSVAHLNYELCSPSSPFAGLVEFDALAMRDAVLRVAGQTLAQAGKVDAVGITTQRASTVVWDANTGLPIGPSLSWQDLRTVGECITAKI